MRLEITRRSRAWLGALAFSGAVGGHILAYTFVAPDAHRRAELLQGTGHGVWPAVVALALAALVGGLAGCLRDGAARLRGSASGSRLYVSTACRLTALQVASFFVLETVERSIAHGHLHIVAGEPAVVVGVVVQVAAALMGAALLVLFGRVIEHFRNRAPHVAAPSISLPPFLCLPSSSRRLVIGCAVPRGPPFSLPLPA